jgi:predicted HNH restriction endonuclease
MLPSQKEIEVPLLQELARRGGSARPSSVDSSGKNVYESLADHFGLTQEERERLGRYDITKGQNRNIWINDVQYTRRHLVDKGLISNQHRGIWKLTKNAYLLLEKENIGSTQTITKTTSSVPNKSNVTSISSSKNKSFSPSILGVIEGKLKEQKCNNAERNKKIVAERRRLDKCTCQVCGFCLRVNGQFIIEVHHLIPLANHEEKITSIDHLICLCPTCHTMAHKKNPPYTPEEIRVLYTKN